MWPLWIRKGEQSLLVRLCKQLRTWPFKINENQPSWHFAELLKKKKKTKYVQKTVHTSGSCERNNLAAVKSLWFVDKSKGIRNVREAQETHQIPYASTYYANEYNDGIVQFTSFNIFVLLR